MGQFEELAQEILLHLSEMLHIDRCFAAAQRAQKTGRRATKCAALSDVNECAPCVRYEECSQKVHKAIAENADFQHFPTAGADTFATDMLDSAFEACPHTPPASMRYT